MAEGHRRKISIDVKVAIIVVSAIALLWQSASFASCTAKDNHATSQDEQATFIPKAPDYNDATMWLRPMCWATR